MQFFKYFVGGVVFTALILSFISLVLLPGDYHITQSIEIAESKKEVYNVVDDLSTWEAWVFDDEASKEGEIIISEQKRSEGANIIMSYSESYQLKMIITETKPYNTIKLIAIMNNGEQESHIEFIFEEINSIQTKVTWKHSGSLGWNVINRLTSSLLNFEGKTAEVYKQKLMKLKNICEE